MGDISHQIAPLLLVNPQALRHGIESTRQSANRWWATLPNAHGVVTIGDPLSCFHHVAEGQSHVPEHSQQHHRRDKSNQ